MIKPTVYYVSDTKGHDTNTGTTPESPLRTLWAVAEKTLSAGDEIRLECGSVFQGQALHLSVQGTCEAPIVIGSYGDGPKPVIDAKGTGVWFQNYRTALDSPYHAWKGYISSAVLLYDCEYIRVEGLEIINNPVVLGEVYNQPDKMNRTGVSVVAQNRGTLHNIELKDLYIHDVKGNVYDKHLNNGGIYCSALKPESCHAPVARYDGLHIHHCVVENCSRWGIAAGYTYTHPFFTTLELPDEVMKKYGHENVVLEHNFVSSIGGDGITPMYCLKPLVQYNVARDTANEINDKVYTLAGEKIGKTAAAIWPWKCKDALLQYNEAYHTCYNQDGQAWDADSGDGTIYQFNYSHNNAGGCIMFCEPESVNNIFRYNISFMDGDGVINPAHNPDAHIYNNTFIMAQGVPFIRDNMSGGHLLVENNIIYNAGEEAVPGDWYHQTEFAEYHNNIYYNFADIPTEDTAAIVVKKGMPLLKDFSKAPTETDGVVHPQEVFACFEPVSPDVVQGGKNLELKGQKDFMGNAAQSNMIGACVAKK